jgi:hypothetical protein
VSPDVAITVTYRPLTPAEYSSALTAANLPAQFATMVTDLTMRGLDGHNAYVADDVPRILGRPATDFSEYVRATTWASATETEL